MRAVLLFIVLMVLEGLGRVSAAKIWVGGGREHPWREIGTFLAVEDTSESGRLQPIDVTGKNISLDVLARGGWIDVNWALPRISIRLAIDGDPTTFFPLRGLSEPSNFDKTVMVDMGLPFAVDSLSFYASEEYPSWFVEGYEIFFKSDDIDLANPTDQYGPGSWYHALKDWKLVAEKRELIGQDTVGVNIPLEVARYVALSDFINVSERHWTMAELEIWGVGYPLRATFTSNVIDLGSLVNVGQIFWSVENDPGSSVNLRTRFGRTPNPNLYYRRTGIGPSGRTPVPKEEYDKLQERERSGVEPDLRNWTPWSAPVETNAQRVVSKGAVRWFQFLLEFQSTSPFARSKVDSVALEISSALIAQEVLGELTPHRIDPGAVTRFTYAVKPTAFQPGDLGFDALRIRTPGRARVQTVRIDGRPIIYTVGEEDSLLTVYFIDQRVRTTGSVVEVEFDARVTVFDTLFEGEVFDSGGGEVPQTVVPGDVLLGEEGNGLTVTWDLGGNLLRNGVLSHPVLTPNGDGVGDETRIGYTLLQVIKPVITEVTISTLNGQEVWKRTAWQGSGYYEIPWNGRDNHGHIVPVGLYLYQITVHLEAGSESLSGTLAVVY
ncbi:MAG: hypothetical protein HY709_01620 [Candidatus Latescibacteria bacterium]|nr:hypothetical protein [Candidatus Latescibacterota bacterium]